MAYSQQAKRRTRTGGQEFGPAVEPLEARTLFSVIPINLVLRSTDVFPTTGSFALSATVTSTAQTGAPTPTGTITFFDGATAIGGVAVGSDGSATLKPIIRQLGSHSITATYSGDLNYGSGVSAVVIESISSSAALERTIRGALPVKVIAGEKTHIHQTLTLAVAKGLAFNGPITGSLFLATGPRIDSEAIQLPKTLAKKVKLKGNIHSTLNINLTSLPATVPTGNYYLLAKLSDSSGSIVTIAGVSTIGVEAPRHDLAGAFAKIPAKAKVNKRFSATILVTNAGNVPLKGSLQIAMEASVTAGPDANLLPLERKPINLRPGRSVRLLITGIIAPAAGSYFLVGEIDPANAFGDANLANNTFVSASVVSVL